MNTYKWPHASLSLASAWSALGNPMGVEKSAHAVSGSRKRSHSVAPFEHAGRATAALSREAFVAQSDEHCPVCYASRHAECLHVVAPGHNEGLDTRYGGEVSV